MTRKYKKDSLFLKSDIKESSFAFNQEVVEVFDDMLDRSVPGYREIIEEQIRIINHYYQNKTFIYDLGCSLGTLSFQIAESLGSRLDQIIAIDSSEEMINECKQRLDLKSFPIQFLNIPLENLDFLSSSVICLNFTLQFIDPLKRQEIIDRIYDSLTHKGILLLSEKISHPDSEIHELMNDRYHDYKRDQGYSDIEIEQKKSALRNVLISESLDTHLERLKKSGFKKILVWKAWYNFISLIAIKS